MRRRWAAALLVGVVLAGGGWLFVRAHRPASGGLAARFDTAEARYGSIDVLVTGTGSVRAAATDEVAARVQATVASVAVGVGDRVAAGDTLVILQDDGTLHQRLLEAQNQLQADRSQLENLLHPDPAEAADVATARAKVQEDEDRVADDRKDIESLSVTAPFAGVVQAVAVEEGDEVAAGAALLTLADTSEAYVDVQVSQLDSARVATGDAARVSVPGYAGSGASGELQGTVVRIAAVAEGSSAGAPPGRGGTAGSANVTVTVGIPNPPSGLASGLAASVSLYPGDGKPPIVGGGTVRYETRTLAASVAGTVVGLEAAEGDPVAAGALLVKLRNDSLATRLASDEALLAEDQAALADLTDPAPPDPDTVASLQRKLQMDQLALDAAEQDLASLVVRAPGDGVVSQVGVSAGDRVSPGQALVEIVDVSHLMADVAVDELDIARVKPGQAVTVTADALPGRRFSGTVATVAPVANASQGVATFTVTIDITGEARGPGAGAPAPGGGSGSESGGGSAGASGAGAGAGGVPGAGPPAVGGLQDLKPGMSVTASIEIARKDPALLVPAEAVVAEGSQGTVRVLGEDGRPSIVPVSVGLTNGTVTEILSGLKEGDVVITALASDGQGQNFRFGGGRVGQPPAVIERRGGGPGRGGGPEPGTSNGGSQTGPGSGP